MFRRLVFVCLVLILAACQAPAAPSPTATSAPPTPPPPTSTPPPPTATPFPESFAGKQVVNGNEMLINCKGTGQPTIVLENGLDYFSWQDPGNFPKISRTCSIARPGMMTDIKGPRTTQDQVKDLHQLLAQTGVPGPYILVGHSIAGYNILLYTDQYPLEIVGIVCVDCRLPSFEFLLTEKLKTKFAQDPDQAKKISDALANFAPPDWSKIKEKLDLATSNEQVVKIKSLGNRPVIALVAQVSLQPLKDIEIQILEAWNEASLQFSRMSTQGRLEKVEDATHLSILKSSVVFNAVQEVYDKVKKP